MRTAVMCVLLSCAVACGDGSDDIHWTSSRSFRLDISANYPHSRSAATKAISDGLAQFAAKVTPDGDQRIFLDYDPTCDNQPQVYAAMVDVNHRSRIMVCLAYGQAIADFKGDETKTAEVVLKHELGHALGLRQHIPTGLMQPVSNGAIRSFQAVDISAICASGSITSPVCN